MTPNHSQNFASWQAPAGDDGVEKMIIPSSDIFITRMTDAVMNYVIERANTLEKNSKRISSCEARFAFP